MMKLVKNPQVSFEVTLPSNSAGDTPSVQITCQVVAEDELTKLGVEERLEKIIVDCEGLQDAHGKKLAWDTKCIPAMMQQPGFQGAFMDAYARAVIWGAEKNLRGSAN